MCCGFLSKKERMKPDCGVEDAGREAEEGLLSLSRVLARVESVWWWTNRPTPRHKGEESEREGDENKAAAPGRAVN
jgi:hypothetical protein